MKIINKQLSVLSLSLLLGLSASITYAEQSKTLEPLEETKVVPVELQFSDAEIDQMLAPIALYPDSVLSQVLVAATYPVEIIQANRWVIKHPDLDANEAMEAVKNKDWDASVKALVPFPRILAKMSEDLEWTQNLGDAFLQDEKVVLDRIQSLREQAYTAGTLKDVENLKVVKEEKTIIIEPAQAEVVYVPYYDPRIVYGSWRWANYPPYYWDYPYSGYYSPYNRFYWGPGIHLSFGFGFGFNWYSNSLVYVDNYYPYRYYNSRQVVRSHYARRWQHNPYHRRGAVYRSRVVTHRYHSNRPARAERYSSRSNSVSRGNSQHRRAITGNLSRDIKGRQQNSVIRPNTRQHRIQAELTERSRNQTRIRDNVRGEMTRESHQSVPSPTRRNIGNSRQNDHGTANSRHTNRVERSPHELNNNRERRQRTEPLRRQQPVVIRQPQVRQQNQSSPPSSRSSYQRSEPRQEHRSSDSRGSHDSGSRGSYNRSSSGHSRERGGHSRQKH
ncbi:MAG TPA: DUF3300 domain-containing protein [Aeromonadales bacterium]|nr:DUF3300 domain-containing protein [Aeromonadales bacterium]